MKRSSISLVTLSTVLMAACGGASKAPMSSASKPSTGYAQPGADAESADDLSDGDGAAEVEKAPMGAPEGAPATPSAKRRPIATAGVKAGEWNDNANYRDFLAYLRTANGHERVDISNRRFLTVQDSAGKAVPGCAVSITDANQKSIRLTTMASGRALLFPHAEGLKEGALVAKAECDTKSKPVRFDTKAPDAKVDLKTTSPRQLPASRTVDLAFVLDSTGSMSEEIRAVKKTIRDVTSMLDNSQVKLRIGLVEFKDRGDELVTKTYKFTSDVSRFAKTVRGIRASGGGDKPESVNAGVHTAITKLNWSKQSVARLAFLIGDAPPHLDYQQDVSYTRSMRRAAHDGIRFYTIAASGMNATGQTIWRQLAQYTGGTNMFVLRGGAGASSVGAGDVKSSCGDTHKNFTSGQLHELIVRKVRGELTAVDGDPTQAPGLGQDEQAKPCAKRLMIAS